MNIYDLTKENTDAIELMGNDLLCSREDLLLIFDENICFHIHLVGENINNFYKNNFNHFTLQFMVYDKEDHPVMDVIDIGIEAGVDDKENTVVVAIKYDHPYQVWYSHIACCENDHLPIQPGKYGFNHPYTQYLYDYIRLCLL